MDENQENNYNNPDPDFYNNDDFDDEFENKRNESKF